jgi:hypothetical protein
MFYDKRRKRQCIEQRSCASIRQWPYSKISSERALRALGINFRKSSQAIFTRSELESGRSEYSELIFESSQYITCVVIIYIVLYANSIR